MPVMPPVLVALVALVGCAAPPSAWDGPVLGTERTQLTVDQLQAEQTLPLLDMSFFARPPWARDTTVPLSGTLVFTETDMLFPQANNLFEREDLFPGFSVELVRHDQQLLSRMEGVLDTRPESASYWDVAVGDGAVWEEDGDEGWSRASLPIQLVGRYVGEVRNCVGTFVFDRAAVSNVYVQCSQETAVLDADQLGDLRSMVPVRYEPIVFPDEATFLDAHEEAEERRIPTAPLAALDLEGAMAEHFDRDIVTNASTSLGAVHLDGTLHLHPAATRHGAYPYPGEMRHGVFSVTKSLAGALAMFHLAERYGEDLFDEPIADHVPALRDLPEWQGVTFAHALNMVTGTRAGEDLLYEPLELAPDSETAIQNIAAFGDFPEAPGERFNYATTHTFVLSYALEHYVQEREGEGIHYWDLVHDDVLVPIGADGFRLLHTRDEDPDARIPLLGLGGLPTVDQAARIASLIANEGEHEGAQLLSRRRVREALGRTGWAGYPAFSGLHYRHAFWVDHVRVGGCRVEVTYMEGLGDNRILFFPSGALSFQFTDEFDPKLRRFVRAVERRESSCPDGG